MRKGFLYPSDDEVREHLRLTAECANLDPLWLAECLKRTANLPVPRLKECTKCKALIRLSDYGIDHRGERERYCKLCRAATPVHEKARKRTCPVAALS